MKNKLITNVIIVIVVGLIAFFGGMKYQESKGGKTAGEAARTVGGRNGGQFGQGRGLVRGGATLGEIISSDDKSITVKMTDGSSKIVLLTDKTQINKAAAGTISDLKTGVRVFVSGTANPDGSETAENIQLNPTFRMDQGSQSGQPKPSQ